VRTAVLLSALMLAGMATPADMHAVDAEPGRIARNGDATLTAGSPSPCADGKYNLLGPARWKQTLNWRFRSSSVPSRLSASGVLDVIKKSFRNVTTARNDCGRPDNVGATSHYAGTTARKPGVSADGVCTGADGQNVVGFAPLSGFYSGFTCIYWIGNEIVEMDMRLDSETRWALSAATCDGELRMEALVTHEVGHAFGLAHVGESRHGRLTMSTFIDGLCENQEATLGLGDMRGLEALY